MHSAQPRSQHRVHLSLERHLARIFILSALIFFTIAFSSTSIFPIFSRIRFNFKSLLSSSFDSPQPTKLPFETFSIAKASAKHPQDAQFAKNLRAFLDIIIMQYTTWHRQQRLLCEADSAHAHSIPLLVFRSNGKAGVGDRIRAILYTYLVAVASNRLFLIDWQKPLPVNDVLPNPPTQNFTYDAMLFTTSNDEENILSGPERYQNLDIYFSPTRVLINTEHNSFGFKRFFDLYDRYPEVNVSRKIVDAGLKHFRVQREEVTPFILNALFQTTPSLRSSLTKLLPFNGRPYISLHARLGHGVGEKSGRFNFKEKGLTLRSASECIGALAATMAQQQGYERVFVATDTERARKFLEAGVHRVMPQAEVAQSSINATHLKAMHGSERFPDESVKQQKFEEVFVDLGLMAMGESMVFFQSGFAETAMWLGAITDSVMLKFTDCTQIVEGKENTTNLVADRRSKTFKDLIRAYITIQETPQSRDTSLVSSLWNREA